MYRSDKTIISKKLYVCYVCQVILCQLSIAFFSRMEKCYFPCSIPSWLTQDSNHRIYNIFMSQVFTFLFVWAFSIFSVKFWYFTYITDNALAIDKLFEKLTLIKLQNSLTNSQHRSLFSLVRKWLKTIQICHKSFSKARNLNLY